MQYIKKYWKELVVFGVIFGILLIDLAPDMTWINTDSDGVHYVYAAKNLFLSHKTSSPLYLLLGNLFIRIPFGTEFWRLGLLSVLSTTIASVFVYLSIKELIGKQWLSLLGALMYGSSAVVISQSTIVETYPLVTMLCIASYYFTLKNKWNTGALIMALGLAVHHLIAVAILPLLLFNKEYRTVKRIAIIASGLLFYLYIPISVKIFHSPDMWGNATASSFFGDNFSTMAMLIGTIAIWDIPKRILDAIGVVGLSLGFGFVLTAWYMIKEKKLLKNQLIWLFSLSIIYYIVDLAPQTYVYVMPSIAFGAVIAMCQLDKLNKYCVWVSSGIAIVLLMFNANYFDIGRTLDPELSATKFYNQELSKIPDGQILMAQYGWEWAMIFPYNKNNDRNIVPIDIDTLISPVYQEYLSSKGVKFNDNYNKDIATRQSFIATSIVNMNDNVWTTIPTDQKNYGSKVVLAKDYLSVLNRLPTEPPAQWHWKPYSPYDIITGHIEISDWKFITYSTKSFRFFALIVTYSLLIYYGILKLIDRKKKLVEVNI